MTEGINVCKDCEKDSLIISEAYFYATEPTKEALITQVKKICATCKKCNGVYLLYDHLTDEWDPDIEKIDEFDKIVNAELRTLLHKNKYCSTCDLFTPSKICDKCNFVLQCREYDVIYEQNT